MRVFDFTDSFRDEFRKDGCVIVRGMFERDQILEIRERLKSRFDLSMDGSGVIGPWKTAQVFRNVKEGKLPRLVRMFYEPPTRDIFVRLVELRNHLIGKPPLWAIVPQDGWWTASRFNQYPVGGGFMAAHSDGEYIGAEPPGGYAQTLLMMSDGKDYSSGGGFIETESGIEMVDHQCEIGDVVIYDGKIRHGVSAIDPHKPLDIETFNGRLVATVSTLKVL